MLPSPHPLLEAYLGGRTPGRWDVRDERVVSPQPIVYST